MQESLLSLFIVLIIYFFSVAIIKRFKISFLDVSGFQYFFLGLLLKFVLPETETMNLKSMDPIIWFCIGIIGLRYGLNLRFTDFGKHNPYGYKIALFDIATTFTTIFMFLSAVFYLFFNRNPFEHESLLPLLSLSSIGVLSSLSATGFIHTENLADGKISDFAIQAIQFQQIVTLILFGIVFLIFHKDNPEVSLSFNSSTWSFINLFLPMFLGFLYQIVLSSKLVNGELKIILATIVIINTGVSYLFNFSPIMFNLIVGIILANTTRIIETIKDEIRLVNHTITSIVLVYAGLTMAFDAPTVIPILLVTFLFARFIGKQLGQKIGYTLIDPTQRVTHNLAWLFISQGRVAIVLAITFSQFYPEQLWASVIQTVVILSVVINEFIGLRTYKNLLIDQEEIVTKEKLT